MRAGLLVRSDLRKKPTKAQLNAVGKYQDFLQGKASIIKTTPKTAKGFKGKYRVKGGLIVVPRERGEKIRFDKKSGDIVSTRKEGEHTVKKIRKPVNATVRREKNAENVYYIMPFQRGDVVERYPFKTWEELEQFMSRGSIRNYKNWQSFVEVEELTRADMRDLIESGELNRPKRKRSRKKRR